MITWEPINKKIDGIYLDSNNMIVPRHNYLTGSKNYALATLEQLIGHLSRKNINDNMVRFLSTSLLELTEKGESRYYEVIKEVFDMIGSYEEKSDDVIEKVKVKFSKNTLTLPENVVLNEISSMNYNEYLFKSDYEKCDYAAMKTLSMLAYEIILQGLQKYIDSVEIFVATNGDISSWEYSYSDDQSEHIWFKWTSLDKIDYYYYSIYEVHCCGLKEDSMLDLASADAVEEQFTTGHNRILSYNMLAKQYCGVIEQEINEIIQLVDSRNKPTKHLMWYEMMMYVRKHNIELISGLFTLNEMLQNLYETRNLSSHGEKISKENYDKIKYYKGHQLFELLSWTKLELKGEIIEPSVDSISALI
ncbi:hypothetical protein [Clostridium estertheticum]|uniref:Apea-like HEPN domain-containing protein n=1 Tax=Clostridium estertheticum TaxID=238834 RepID=A0A7Y3T0L1_9CLOT|nr:hypothetical protein [Clostridium estertheticum]NNU78483.1 hypothetical protein [Clostridium estertheticum]